jgi:hypothetical protein
MGFSETAKALDQLKSRQTGMVSVSISVGTIEERGYSRDACGTYST